MARTTTGRTRRSRSISALFTVSSLAVGVAQSAGWLIAARAVQGGGAALLAPSTLALLSTTFREGPERTRAVAYYGAVAGTGASLGLVLGGVLTDLVSWRVGFLLNVPFGIAMLLAAPRYLPETLRQPGRLDVGGAVTSTLGMVARVYGLVRAADAGWSDTATDVALVAGVVLLAEFVLHERGAEQPIMPLRLFVSGERAAAYAARALFLAAMMGFWFFTTQYLQSVRGDSPLRLVVTLLGMAWLSRLTADTSYLTGVALPMVLIGAGQGASLSPLTAAGIAGVAREDAGAASGLVNVAHQVGGSLGLGVLVTVFAAAGPSDLGASAMLSHRVGVSLTVGAGMLAAALVLVLVLVVRNRPTRLQEIRA